VGLLKLSFTPDLPPSVLSAHGEGETIVELPERLLVWRDVLDLSCDKANFYYHFTERQAGA
jgi:hypothetical protein